jgi:hypothetical protein
MNRNEIVELLHELSDRLESRGVHGELFVVGGAAMALAYSTRRSTSDLDAIFEPKGVIYDVAASLAADRGLPATWLNDAVKAYLPGADPNARVVLDLAGLTVTIASPRYLLAMKLLASRIERDEDDIRLLLRLSGISDADEALDLIADLYPSRIVEPKVQYFVRELLDPPDAG